MCHFALGRIFDVTEKYENAIKHYEKANSLCAKGHLFDEDQLIQQINQITALFTGNSHSTKENTSH